MNKIFKNTQNLFNVIDQLEQDLEQAISVTFSNFRLSIVHFPNVQILWQLRQENPDYPKQLFRIAEKRTKLMLNNVDEFDTHIFTETKAALFRVVRQDIKGLKETFRGYLQLANLQKKENYYDQH